VPSTPRTRYAKSGDVNIAYQVLGEGPTDLVFISGFLSHLELAWEEPYLARFLRRLASFSRLILFDKRGVGLSDPATAAPRPDDRMDDIRAVMDAVGSERAALFGVSEGGGLAISFDVTYPARTAAIVAYGAYARRLRSEDYPWGVDRARFEELIADMDRGWSDGHWWDVANPSAAVDERYRAWWARYLRAAASPARVRSLMRMNATIDVRPLLPKVTAPTLIVHRTGDDWIEVGNGRYLAAHIPGARLLEVPGTDHRPWLGDADTVLDAVETFVTGRATTRGGGRGRFGPDSLSRREREVVALTIAGESAADIAGHLFISERTVESHLAGAYTKLGVRSRLELLRRADEFGL
jgi:pimeloyl-ACP methyl ester carboxylesterase/DNA-binding CsgD family transcriptional regulator